MYNKNVQRESGICTEGGGKKPQDFNSTLTVLFTAELLSRCVCVMVYHNQTQELKMMKFQ